MIIREVDLFKGIASHIIDEIAQLAVEEVYPRGTVIFKRADFADSLYILEEGRVDLLLRGAINRLHVRGQHSAPVYIESNA